MLRLSHADCVHHRIGYRASTSRVALTLALVLLGVQDLRAQKVSGRAMKAGPSAGAVKAQQIRDKLRAEAIRRLPRQPIGPPALRPLGFVYAMTDEGGVEGRNAIRAFGRDASGLLTELPGSPVLTLGTGVHPTADLSLANLGPFDSDQSMIFDHTRTRLFAVNSGSDTIAVLNVGNNGLPVHVKGSPFPSGGLNPVSVGLSSEGVLVVANKDYDLGRPGFDPNTQGNYTSFLVNRTGQLFGPVGLVPGGVLPIKGPGRATPTQALISPDGTLAFDANFFGFAVRSFRILPNGALLSADAQMIPSPGGTNALGLPIPLGLQVHPTQPILYVGFVLDKAFGVYTYDANGKLTFVRAITNVGNGPCWFLTNSAGTRLYISNNFDNTIAVFDTTNPLQPVKIQSATLAQGFGIQTTASPFQIALDSANQYLYAVTQKAFPMQDAALANGLNVLKVNADGTLVVTDFVPFPSSDGTRPQGVAAR